jgi:hypothetical protein
MKRHGACMGLVSVVGVGDKSSVAFLDFLGQASDVHPLILVLRFRDGF